MTFSSLKRSPAYPAPSSPGLAQSTGHPEERWLDMTFFHLVGHFGCAMNPSALHRFLAGRLAPSLRYCPICLAEHTPACYSLLWRFLVLSGCIEHGVRFLDQCGHCGSPLPLLRRLPRLTTCPTCQGDLRTSLPSRLSSDDLEPTDKQTNDLKMLLTPLQRPLEQEQAKLIGKRLQLLRQRRDLWIPEVAHLLGRHVSVVQDIDYVSRFRQASLDDYMQYAEILGYSLREIFDEQSLQELLAPVSEEHLLDQVEAAIHQLKARGKPILPGSIGDLMGMTGRRLKQLEARGEPIVLPHVCDLVGLTYSWMVKKYPRIKALFHHYQKNRDGRCLSPRLDEEEKAQQVQAAITLLVSHGEPVTLRQIRQIVGLTQKQLRCSPRVKALLAQDTARWQGEAS